MKVILQDNVQKLGNAGDVVDISRGYFRNFLEPRGLAVLATKGTLKKREEDLEALKRKADKAIQAARDVADKIAALPALRIETKAGESGKLYGKVTNKEVAAVIEELTGTRLDKRSIKILEPVNTLGSYKVQVKLMAEVQCECTIAVVLEGSPVVEATAEGTEEAVAASQEEIAEEMSKADSHTDAEEQQAEPDA